jgi:hypothetical protein
MAENGREAIFRYCFHLVNSWRDAVMSPGATRSLFSIASTVTSFKSLFPPPRASSSSARVAREILRCGQDDEKRERPQASF